MSKSQKLVLLGGGHTHALVCLHFLRNPKLIQANNLDVVLISEEADSPYSGMLPGLIEDYYNECETHINLIKLCESAQVRLIIEKVAKIDVQKNLLYFDQSSGRPPFSFDYLSINTGSIPSISANLPNAVPVKPIADFLTVIKTLSVNESISLIGGGISGVEVALALRSRFPAMTIDLYSNTPLLGRWHFDKFFNYHLKKKNIDVFYNKLPSTGKNEFLFTGAGARPYPQHDLPKNATGFIKVTQTLQVKNHPNVFASGDCAEFPLALPKSGVYAVRMAKTLIYNLLAITQKPAGKLKKFRPQKTTMALIGLGGQKCILTKGPWLVPFCSGLLWGWKEYIDRKFMNMFSMSAMEEMKCLGCAAKIGPRHLPFESREDVSETAINHTQKLIQSVDSLPGLLNDPYLDVQIALNHAISDLHAKGKEPQSILFSLRFPEKEKNPQVFITEIFAGIKKFHFPLLSGHTFSGPGNNIEYSFTVQTISDTAIIPQRNAQAGDVLIISKAIGVGIVARALREGAISGKYFNSLKKYLLKSNGETAKLFCKYPVSSCTDITGFGFAGHALQLLSPDISIKLDMEKIPLLPGAAEAIKQNIKSSLFTENSYYLNRISGEHPLRDILFDPQTVGPLLATIPKNQVPAILAESNELVVIGEIIATKGDSRIFL